MLLKLRPDEDEAGAGRPVIVRHVAGAVAPPPGRYGADIVILAHGRPLESIAAIASATAQRGVLAHVTVLDQGSPAGDLAQLADFVRPLAGVTLLAAAANGGVAAGRNAATAFGHGEIIVGLDNDATFANETVVQRAAGCFRDDPALAAVGFRILLAGDGRDDALSWGYGRERLCDAAGSFDASTFVGAGHAIRRAAWEQAGGYDEALFFCWEEKEFCLRAIARGWRVRYRGDLAVLHKVSPDRRLGWRDGRWFYFVRNRIYMARKHEGPARTLLLGCGYAVKGLRNGLAAQTARALWAAARMRVRRETAGRAEPIRPWRRLCCDVMARLPGT